MHSSTFLRITILQRFCGVSISMIEEGDGDQVENYILLEILGTYSIRSVRRKRRILITIVRSVPPYAKILLAVNLGTRIRYRQDTYVVIMWRNFSQISRKASLYVLDDRAAQQRNRYIRSIDAIRYQKWQILIYYYAGIFVKPWHDNYFHITHVYEYHSEIVCHVSRNILVHIRPRKRSL